MTLQLLQRFFKPVRLQSQSHAYDIRDMNLPSIPPYDAEQHVHVIVVSQDFIVANLITQPPVEYQPVADKPYTVKGRG